MVGITYIRVISDLSEICTCLPDLTISKVIKVIIKSAKLIIHTDGWFSFIRTSPQQTHSAEKPAQR